MVFSLGIGRAQRIGFPRIQGNGEGDTRRIANECCSRYDRYFSVVLRGDQVHGRFGLGVVIVQVILEGYVELNTQGRSPFQRENIRVEVVVDFVVSGHRSIRRDVEALAQNRIERRVFDVVNPRCQVKRLRSIGRYVQGLGWKRRVGRLIDGHFSCIGQGRKAQ